MHRLLTLLREPVAWILAIAGVMELLSGGTAARGAILFAGAALIVADRVRVVRLARVPTPAAGEPPDEPAPVVPNGEALITAIDRPALLWAGLASCMALAWFEVHGVVLTAVTGIVGIGAVGWAWLTVPAARRGDRPPLRGLAVWGGLLLLLGLWELAALLGQADLAVGSYDHPTISYLTDPALTTYAGRVVGLVAWALAGRGLVRRS